MKSLLFACAIVTLCACGARAQTYTVSNLDLSNTNQTTVSDNAWGATSFTTNGTAYQFDALTARFRGSRDAQDSTYTVRLFTDRDGLPGTFFSSLQTANPTVARGSFREIVWMPTMTTLLSPLTTYWVVFGGATGGAINATNSPAQDGVWTIGNSLAFSANDVDWNIGQSAISFQFGINATPSVTASAAPEPGSLALLVLPLIGAIVARRRKVHGSAS